MDCDSEETRVWNNEDYEKWWKGRCQRRENQTTKRHWL